MYLPDTNLMILQKIFNDKQCNALNINSLVGGGIAQQLIHTLFLQTTCSDATRRYLKDALCPVGKDQLYQNFHVENDSSNNRFGSRDSAW